MRAYNNDKHKYLMEKFHELFSLIDKNFNSSVALVGKLGIEEFFNEYIDADQINILIPKTISEKKLKAMLVENNYEIIERNIFKKNEIIFTYNYLEKYIDLCNIKDMKELIKVIPNDPSDEIKENSKLLIKWVEEQNGYYMFDKEQLSLIYQNDSVILDIINNIK